MNTLRIATFNLENLDDKPCKKPTLAERISVMEPQILRLKVDILCLLEVNGQESPAACRRAPGRRPPIHPDEDIRPHQDSLTITQIV